MKSHLTKGAVLKWIPVSLGLAMYLMAECLPLIHRNVSRYCKGKIGQIKYCPDVLIARQVVLEKMGPDGPGNFCLIGCDECLINNGGV